MILKSAKYANEVSVADFAIKKEVKNSAYV